MKRIIKPYLPLVLSLLLIVGGIGYWPSTANAAGIAFDTSTDQHSGASVTNWSFSYTVTGANPILFVSVGTFGGPVVTGITYNSVALTKINEVQQSGTSAAVMSMWVLAGPATGAHTLAISQNSSNTSGAEADVVSYTGAKQTAQPDSSSVQSFTNATGQTGSTTVVAASSWIVWGTYYTDASATFVNGMTSRQHSSAEIGIGIEDSNATVGTGSQSFTQTTNSGTQPQMGIMASFAPAITVSSNAMFFAGD